MASLLPILGCTMPGDLAEGVDLVEGRLVQTLIDEDCGDFVMRDHDGNVLYRKDVKSDDIAILEISDLPDGGRLAWFRVHAREFKFSYHPHYGMVTCGEIHPGELYDSTYTHPSRILMNHGGNPKLYEPVLAEIRRRQEEVNRRFYEKLRKSRTLDATFPIRVKWNGIAGEIRGTIREVRVGSEGTMVIELPRSMESTCTGTYSYTGHNVGTWNVTCPDNLTASGTFKSGAGAHGKGIDNAGRKVTYTIDVKN